MIRRLIVALGCVLLVASCANIPEQTNAQVIPNSSAQPQQKTQPPARDADPITLVRRFIEASGDTAVAESYLTEDAKRQWRPDNLPTIIEDEFSTVPQALGKDADPNVTSVEVKYTTKGWLDSRKSFNAQIEEQRGIVNLVRQPDGQWRISETPGNGLIIPISAFNNHFRPVKLYFYDSSREIPVPDQRYLPGNPLASASDIVGLLLQGPATALQGAVRSALPSQAVQRTNVTPSSRDGATVVNLGNLGNLTLEDKRAIAAQVVLSLQDVATTTVRLQVEGLPLVPDQPDWKLKDIQPESDRTTPKAQLNGMMVAGNRVKDLRDGKPIANPAGSGEYRVESAAQSVDGSQLAVVERLNTGQLRLRAGAMSEGLRETPVVASEMTRPTWQFAVASNEIGNEVWVVADGLINRLVRNREGLWVPLPVNQSEVDKYGKITELRLSRDGVRVAVVAGGKLLVGAVMRTPGSTNVAISVPKYLLPSISNVVSVDWLDPSRLVVATNTSTGPVWQVPVDGIDAQRYNLANLTLPLSSITAAPSRQIVVTDTVGMWTASEIGEVWLPHPQSAAQGPTARPFYPG